jgi:hypothetical protein
MRITKGYERDARLVRQTAGALHRLSRIETPERCKDPLFRFFCIASYDCLKLTYAAHFKNFVNLPLISGQRVA